MYWCVLAYTPPHTAIQGLLILPYKVYSYWYAGPRAEQSREKKERESRKEKEEKERSEEKRMLAALYSMRHLMEPNLKQKLEPKLEPKLRPSRSQSLMR